MSNLKIKKKERFEHKANERLTGGEFREKKVMFYPKKGMQLSQRFIFCSARKCEDIERELCSFFKNDLQSTVEKIRIYNCVGSNIRFEREVFSL